MSNMKELIAASAQMELLSEITLSMNESLAKQMPAIRQVAEEAKLQQMTPTQALQKIIDLYKEVLDTQGTLIGKKLLDIDERFKRAC